ncbi:MAG: hypothetical protein J07HN4v3_02667 [Halonotius sp. J07HN4]|nr:MAG: hypothetical protein J07HN4v3_02667 [Halonotius sp. J07HN4]
MTGSPSTVGRSPADTESPSQGSHEDRLPLTRPIRWLGFWAAIVLPAVYLPVLSLGIGTHTGAVSLDCSVVNCLHCLLATTTKDHNP